MEDRMPGDLIVWLSVVVIAVVGGFVIHRRSFKAGVLSQFDLVYRDELTGLLNRRALEGKLKAPAEGVHCMLVLDLNGFKPINDSLGHGSGDEVLVEVARRLRDRVEKGRAITTEDDLIAFGLGERTHDKVIETVNAIEAVVATGSVYRNGGDEMSVVVGPFDEPTAEIVGRALAISIAGAIAGPMHLWRHGEVRVSASIGLACGPLGKELLRQADCAMYNAKKAKTEPRVVVFHQSMKMPQSGSAPGNTRRRFRY
jgi:GGDEF domain-containing protein